MNTAHTLIIDENVMTACWDDIFKWPGKTAFSPQAVEKPAKTSINLPPCHKMMENGLLGYVWLANQRNIHVPPKSEVLVWGWAWMGQRGTDFCGGSVAGD